MSFFANAMSCGTERTEWPTLSFRSHSMCSIASAALSCSAVGRLRRQDHQIEVAVRRHFAAPGAAERDQRDLLA